MMYVFCFQLIGLYNLFAINGDSGELGLEDCIRILQTLSSSSTEIVNDTYPDILTPYYYDESVENSLKNELNQFLIYVRKEQFHHPLQQESHQIPEYSVASNGQFDSGKGRDGTSEYHTAVDCYVGNKETHVNVYAAHDGYVTIVKDAAKYRHYISITKTIHNDKAQVLGKLITLYAHLDLDLDEAESLNMNEKTVQKGDLISKNLYSGTTGGPHLHFEIRYYRKNDIGNETYYGDPNAPGGSAELTVQSAGIWIYGYWNPNVGYGFGNPINHGLFFY